MASKYIDTSAIIQVIGCVYNNPKLLDYTDKYTITEDDFDNEFHKVIYGSIYKLHELGATEITSDTIKDFLSTRPKYLAIYENQKGEKWLQEASIHSNNNTFDYYYNRLKKFSLLRAYDKYGINVSELYDPDNILDTKKKQIQEEWLDNSSLEIIAKKIDDRIEEIKYQYISDIQGDSFQAGEGIDELIDDLLEHPEVGAPLFGPLINTVTRGARLGKFYLRSAPSGTGKAIPNYTLIPTPIGWRKVGDIKEGDYLFGQDGKPTKVLKIYPQPEDKEIWKITFSDGRIAECCGEHLWEYRYETHSGKAYRVEDIQTIYNRTLTLKNGLKNSDNKGYRFHIKLNEAIEYPKKQYSLSPYVMGAFLGDGSFRYNKTNKSLTFSTADTELLDNIISQLGEKYYYHKNSGYNYNYTFKNKNNPKHNIWVEEFLKDYPQLWNTKSEDKFIPKDYLQGSIEQRYELLQGLLDTDGNIDKEKGRVNYFTISPYLRDNIIELCRSLGFIASYTIDKRKEQYTTGEGYGIHIQCKKTLKPNLFKLTRKKKIAEEYKNNGKREEFKTHLAIVKIEKTNKKVPMTCFTVDNENHLFLMNDFITTHNTRSMIADACYLSCDKYYQEGIGWIKSGGGQEPSLYITTEQSKDEIQTMMLAFLSQVNEENILNGSYKDDELARVREAGQVLRRAPLHIVEIPDFSLEDIENIIKKGIRDYGIKYIFHDYIHTSIKILEEISRRSGGIKLREDNILFMLSTRLKDICNQYGVFILSATQLNADYQVSETPDQNLLRGSKAIADCRIFPVVVLGRNTK